MGNRALKRSIARNLMGMAGLKKINKRSILIDGDPERNRLPRRVSPFSKHWRAWLDPESDERKALEAKLKRDAMIESRASGKKVRAPWPVPR